MESIISELEQGAEFAALASRYSEDTSKAAGGDLGYFHRGQMVAPFEEAAFRTSVGGVSEIVETVYGLHVIEVLDHQPMQVVPEELAQQQIYEHLLEVKRRQAMRNEVSSLRANAEIEVLIPL
jgi:parvulin-like peptidyl-prolyl isomerase